MKIITATAHPDEPCFGMVCGKRLVHSPDGSQQYHWVERYYVVRGDAIAEYSEDFGPAENFKEIPELQMPSFGNDSVGQLRDFADRHRQDLRWAKRLQERKGESTLMKDMVQQFEEGHELIANRSVIGPHRTIQRNGYDRNIVKRKQRERRKEYYGIIPQNEGR